MLDEHRRCWLLIHEHGRHAAIAAERRDEGLRPGHGGAGGGERGGLDQAVHVLLVIPLAEGLEQPETHTNKATVSGGTAVLSLRLLRMAGRSSSPGRPRAKGCGPSGRAAWTDGRPAGRAWRCRSGWGAG